MNYSQFLYMIPEAALTAALVILFVADFCSAKDGKRSWFNPLASLLLALVTVVCCYTTTAGEASAFGGMYQANAGVTVVKTILALGTFIVVLMSKAWITREESRVREGEFYMLTVSTLLGMFMMMSAGHFLLFFLGLEMASVPLATMVAFDLHRNDSAEAAAKFILTATFSSGVMLFGISFLYGMCGTLYFDDVALQITRQGCTPLLLMGLVFFFSGLGFKISLVPFHFWTADTYQGAPTTVTGYLSVISKGAAAFTLLSILFANLFAIRQHELKRFMAFSSISQAGYIMLAAVGTSWQMSASALAYYVLIYVVANMAVFTIISVVEQNNGGKTQISDYDGFYTTNPKLSFLMTLALFSLGGIPPFAGMFSKFFIFMAGVKGHDVSTTMGAWAYAVVFIALVNTVISLYYYLKIVKAMYIRKSDHPLPTFQSDGNTKFALAICTVGVVLFGICSAIFNTIFDLM